MIQKSTFILGTILLTATSLYATGNPSYCEKAIVDTLPFYEAGQYDPTIPKPGDYLKHPIGQWPVHYYELVPYLERVAAASDRVVMEAYARTHEGRELLNLFISSEENIRNLEQLRRSTDTLADPELLTNMVELDRLVAELPAFAWLGYCVHGDELSPVDAAIQLIYHLAAANDAATTEILKNVIIIIDPLQNPDGRERYLAMLETYQSHVPNYNHDAMQHQGVWPWGRTNHYLFDINRDWILLTQPETRGKVATIQKWHPQLVVDAHEMGHRESFLFSPPIEPINYNTPRNVPKWYNVFGKDQAATFDQRGWTYYVGEWHEQWYPGYGSAWPAYFGSVAILYEMARVDGMFVRQPDNYLLTYHEAVNKQFTSSLANLSTLATNREAILRDYHETRKEIIEQGKRSGLTFLFAPDKDELKMQRFIERLLGQGIEVDRAATDFTGSNVHDIYGKKHNSKQFPAGTYLVSTAQVNGALAKAVLEFDPHLKKDFLEEERREIEKHSDTKMYEVSTWSPALAYDLETYWTTSRVNVKLNKVTRVETSSGRLINPDARVGFIIDMVGEKTYQVLGRLFSKDVVIRASEKAFTVEGKAYAAGALFLRKRGNPGDLAGILKQLAEEIGLDIHGVNTSLSTEGSNLGAPTFKVLTKPKVAIIAGDGINYTSFGALWFTVDKELEIPHSLINLSNLGRVNLDEYNVLVLPASWGKLAPRLGNNGKHKLEEWVKGGGTLICTGNSAVWAADTAKGISEVRLKRQVLDKLSLYESALKRELTAEKPEVDTIALWYPEKIPEEKTSEKLSTPDSKMLKEQDEWQRKFSPTGVILRANLDTEHWLAFGMKESVPVMVNTRHAFMAKSPVKTVARFSDKNSLRLSGLLWPEARERWANTAYLTRESKGSGQVILLATDPNPRAYFYGTRKLFVNAVLYGPGMGAGFREPWNVQE